MRYGGCSVPGCDETATVAMQDVAGDITFTRLGSHYRGFPIISICVDHAQAFSGMSADKIAEILHDGYAQRAEDLSGSNGPVAAILARQS